MREPYRVMVIDDVVDLAHHYALVLRQAGMLTEVMTDTDNIFQKLENFKPELILLDYYFPNITGMEIAKVLRQHPAHFGIPIVYISTETDPEVQLQILREGDDFLQKPIIDNHLVSKITSRVERARVLSKMMYYDGLTALLNQVTLKQRLGNELSRCQRQNSVLTYAMIDLDHFKSVNDRYGHVAGDQVLKALAQLLISRLRSTDSVGRYGGEEFAIIMPDTTLEDAYNIVDVLRNEFSELVFQQEDQEFTVSFSAGIACSSNIKDQHRLIETADEALYQAKNKGRNKIIKYKASN